MRSFPEVSLLRYIWKCKTANEIFFPLSIWSVGKRGMALRGVPSPPCSDLSKVAVERLYISFELTGIWNVIDRFPELNHYLVFDCNVSFFSASSILFALYLCEKGLDWAMQGEIFLSFCKINEDVFTGPQHSVHTTIMDFSLCWLKALFLCYLSILYLLLDCNIKGYLAKHWNNSCVVELKWLPEPNICSP